MCEVKGIGRVLWRYGWTPFAWSCLPDCQITDRKHRRLFNILTFAAIKNILLFWIKADAPTIKWWHNIIMDMWIYYMFTQTRCFLSDLGSFPTAYWTHNGLLALWISKISLNFVVSRFSPVLAVSVCCVLENVTKNIVKIKSITDSYCNSKCMLAIGQSESAARKKKITVRLKISRDCTRVQCSGSLFFSSGHVRQGLNGNPCGESLQLDFYNWTYKCIDLCSQPDWNISDILESLYIWKLLVPRCEDM